MTSERQECIEPERDEFWLGHTCVCNISNLNTLARYILQFIAQQLIKNR